MCPAGFTEIHRFGTLGSTNDYLLDQARRGAPEGSVVVTDHQSAGRGRLGRRWEAPAGTGLLASVLLRPVLDPGLLSLCPAAAALAAVDACRSVAWVTPEVKWPNDLLVKGRKLAGVLADLDSHAPGGPAGSVAVVVGMGLNLDWPGPEGDGGTCLSEEAGRRIDRDELLGAWLEALGPRAAALGSPEGRGSLITGWRESCGTLGRRVRVELTRGAVVGTAVDLTAAGHLVVETGAGLREVAAGDVEHLRPAGGPPA